MKVKFKKLHEGTRLPKKATAGSAAYDLFIPEDTIVRPGRQVIPLGFAMAIPDGYEALIDARSGFSSKGMEGFMIGFVFSDDGKARSEHEVMCITPQRMDCDVTQGKIDSDYRDGVGVIVHSREDFSFIVKAGLRIAQMTFHKVETAEWEETDELSATDRKGGFGSSGTKDIES